MTDKVLWSGRFGKGPEKATLEFTSSLPVDVRLAWYDVMGSIAHARMLGKQGIIKREDGESLVDGLKGILQEIEKEEVRFDPASEDVHSAVEILLTRRIGEAGARLHTARSRNDQVATDLRLFLRDATLQAAELIVRLQAALLAQAEQHQETLLPGFTHTQHAQPVTLSFHLLAHVSKLQRDADRLIDSYDRLNVCPLGSAALAGTSYEIDRFMTAQALGFHHPSTNAMDSVSDRDFALEYLFIHALTMTHLSSLAEELVLWSSQEFGFVEIDEEHSTGSSIMPQKKNPDVAELIRGRSARSISSLVGMLTLLKGLPLAYNRDLQEDKEAVFAAHDNLSACLMLMSSMVAKLRYDEKRMAGALQGGFLNATDLADYLVKKGMPFRQAHEVVGKAVRLALAQGKSLEELDHKELTSLSPLIGTDVVKVLDLRSCVARRTSYGGTAPVQVENQMDRARDELSRQRGFCKQERERLVKVWNELLFSY